MTPRGGSAAGRSPVTGRGRQAESRGGRPRPHGQAAVVALLLVGGCAAPQYAVRPSPVPEESAQARQIEQAISALQARELESRQRVGTRPVQRGERLFGFDLQATLERLSRVTERPNLPYHIFLLRNQDPNAVALADGRTYVTTGILNYLASRGSREDELATVLSHELAHTVAQHLVKRYQQLQQQQLLLTVVGIGAAVAARQGGAQAQQMGQAAQDIAGLLSDVAASGYSQEQELEADQLGVRYMIRAGYDPRAALELLQDFARFDTPSLFLRTHPPTARRLEDLARYLAESGPEAAGRGTPPLDEQRRRLLEAQQLYPPGSQSWKNIQRQLEELGRGRFKK
ncbi:MAG: M48 family metalloprotease [Candidatus Omnitrophica bacterium]|nr:M48 family metalloprotease [Candidatus Omnitrophota bacterium]